MVEQEVDVEEKMMEKVVEVVACLQGLAVSEQNSPELVCLVCWTAHT